MEENELIAELRGRVAAAERKLREYEALERSLRYQTGEENLELSELLLVAANDRAKLNGCLAKNRRLELANTKLRLELVENKR